MNQKYLLLCICTFLACMLLSAQQNSTQKKPITIGESVTFPSTILDQERILNIYLPESYTKEASGNYPVIYLLDGSMDEDFIHIAGLVQFGSFSWIQMVPESIVVGISNIDRKHDFTFPTKNKKDKEEFPTTGGSKDFIDFLEKELQPYINKNYRTTNTKTIIGQSLGGLLATEILFKKPQLFDNYIIVSPSLWWDDESLLKFAPATFQKKKSIYIAVGKEGPTMERTAKELYYKLNIEGEKNYTLNFKFLEAQEHGDALHLAAYGAFEAIFKQQK
ncbi:ferri-bacillibactin esterase BesA [Kordia sp. SMS9]|uniref:alpha/beta hydrolase n=1 Tax=Kordia sp. SMS9 TaxID=2282170 RepID=UPI000E0CCE4B|nr:alpha/beta hydrolase-fold protein [Kordia sp. SMS9]AXG71965.1 ferri-bacillibactin esterase BesA [Kordia sp. SMS9]